MENTIKIENVEYTTHDCLTFGDYGGAGSVGLANIRFLKEAHPDFIHAYMQDVPGNEYTEPVFEGSAPAMIWVVGSYASETVYIRADIWTENEYGESLENYPAFDDEIISEIESDWESEGFEIWARSDLYSGLPERNQTTLENMTPEKQADIMWAAYRQAMEDCNEYPTPEYSGSHIPVDDIQETFNVCVIALLKETTPAERHPVK
jgi:hypothetical protein